MATASASTSEHDVSAGFEWDEGYNSIIEQIALTDVVESDWPTLRDILKHKLHINVVSFLSKPKPTIVNSVTGLSTSSSGDPPVGLQPSPFAHSPVIPSDTDRFPSTNGLVTMPADEVKHEEEVKVEASEGLVDTPMSDASTEGLVDKEHADEKPAVTATNGAATSEEREKEEMREVEKAIGNGLGPADVIGGRTLPNWMNEQEAVFMEKRLRELLDEFPSRPPFTIQRLCELLHNPTAIHSAAGKYLRAIERTLLVTSSWTPPVLASDSNGFLPGSGAPGGAPGSSSSSSDGGTPRYANTPIFSPIPFLVHDEDLSGAAAEDGTPAGGMLMSPLVLGGASTTGAFPSSGSASVPVIDLPTSSTGSTPTSSTHPSTLSAEELRVDEFDAGVIPTSILPPVEGADASVQPHLISLRPRALSSTSDFSGKGKEGEEEPSSPLGLMRAVDLPDLGEPIQAEGSAKRAKIQEEGADFDELPTGGQKRVVIPPANVGGGGVGRTVVFESAKVEEEEEGGDKGESERERRSQSPTPDPGKIVAAKVEQGEKMKVDLPGEGKSSA